MVDICQLQEIRWAYGLFRKPPDNLPTVLAEQIIFVEKVRGAVEFEEIEELYSTKKPPSGYAMYWSILKAPPKTMSNEFRANIRIRKLKERIYKKYPMFADEFIEREFLKNAEYYSGKLDNSQIEIREEEQLAYEKSIKNAHEKSGLIVHVEWWNH